MESTGSNNFNVYSPNSNHNQSENMADLDDQHSGETPKEELWRPNLPEGLFPPLNNMDFTTTNGTPSMDTRSVEYLSTFFNNKIISFQPASPPTEMDIDQNSTAPTKPQPIMNSSEDLMVVDSVQFVEPPPPTAAAASALNQNIGVYEFCITILKNPKLEPFRKGAGISAKLKQLKKTIIKFGRDY